MKPHRCVQRLAFSFLFFLIIVPSAGMAGEIDLIVPTNFSSIQAAINYASALINSPTPTTNTFKVLVEPGIYSGTITLASNIPLRGIETAATFLSGGGSGPVISASGVTSAYVKNFTIMDASLGISISNNSSVIVENNVFDVGTSGTAVQIQSSPSAQVVNNTFYNSGTAIIRDADSEIIDNNIFYNNITNISQGAIVSTDVKNITYNAFFPTTTGPLGTNYIPNTIITLNNPEFVNVSNFDFHLMAGSPCIANGDPTITNIIDGTQSDMGAYGGGGAIQNMDTIPFQISGVSASLASPTSVTLNWNANNDYLINGYKVYYGSSSGTYTGTEAHEGSSPITVPTGTSATTFTMTGLNFTPTTPATPTINTASPLNEALALSWSAVSGATGYKVYYGTVSPPTTAIDVGNVTSYTLSGLTNGQTYYVAVSAYSQALLYMAVTCFYPGAGPDEPGVQFESYYSQEVTAGSGSVMESPLSSVLSDFPEALVAYPNLPNSHVGCFIATAAYGYYSAPQVQALREFRNRYLLTNRAGNAFVEWYYRVSPAAADYLNNHPGYKPLVRAALFPAVAVSLFLTKTSLTVKIGSLLTAGFFIMFLFYMKRLSGSGGSH
ncbi:MAG TPA: CFI-box-CTERM domain-containing protein [Nitrospirota bacterium]|nr:CFI-box-CTERM domain-containing protein [Nitrospirota bacterium]